MPLSFSTPTHPRQLQGCTLARKQTDASLLRANSQKERMFSFSLVENQTQKLLQMSLSLLLEGLRKHRPGCSFSWSTVQHLKLMEKMTKRE